VIEEDISAIKDIVLKPLPQLDDDDDDYYYDYYRENLPLEDTATNAKYDVSGGKAFNEDDSHRKNERLPLIHKGSLFRRTSVIPKAAAEYDIAIVLTGLNDVKEAFMPHMNSGSGHGPTRLENSFGSTERENEWEYGSGRKPRPKQSRPPAISRHVSSGRWSSDTTKHSRKQQAPKNYQTPIGSSSRTTRSSSPII